MSGFYKKAFKNSLLGHGLAVLLAVVVTFCMGWKKHKPSEIPIEFTVIVESMPEVAAEPEVKKPPAPKPPPPAPKPPPPADAVVAVKKPVKPPKPKPVPPKPVPPKPEPPKPTPKAPAAKPQSTFKKGERVVRDVAVKAPPLKLTREPTLSADEIARLLAAGAKPGTENSIPQGEVERCFMLVKQALYNGWERPSRSDAGRRAAEIELSFGTGGTVTAVRLTKSSGSAIHDRSAVAAGRAVGKINGLTGRFLRQYPRVTVDFELE